MAAPAASTASDSERFITLFYIKFGAHLLKAGFQVGYLLGICAVTVNIIKFVRIFAKVVELPCKVELNIIAYRKLFNY